MDKCSDGNIMIYSDNYRKLGFATVPMEEAPPVSKCLTCPRYQVDCNSEIMVYKL